MAWILLVVTVLLETAGATATGVSEGFTRPVPVVLALVTVLAAYYTLSLALKRGMGVGVAYGLWTALGVALVALIGVLFLGDRLTPLQTAGLALVMAGALALELGRAKEPEEAGELEMPEGPERSDRPVADGRTGD